mgnify:CR=1 FL=1
MKVFLAAHGYTSTGVDENRDIITKWAKEFPYVETIETDKLKSFITTRMFGADKQKACAKTTLGKHLSVLKHYWIYCLDRLQFSPNNSNPSAERKS